MGLPLLLSSITLLTVVSSSVAQFFDRDGTVKAAAAAANLTNAFNTPYAYYDLDRDPRRWFSSPYGPLVLPVNGGVEAIVIGLMIAVGIGFIILPLLMILYSTFYGQNGSGSLFRPPGATTFVGRKKREVLKAMFPQIHPQTQEKVLDIFNDFIEASDKMAYLKKAFQQ